jgi:hypothetical protein
MLSHNQCENIEKVIRKYWWWEVTLNKKFIGNLEQLFFKPSIKRILGSKILECSMKPFWPKRLT